MHDCNGFPYRIGNKNAAPMFPKLKNDAKNAQKIATAFSCSGSLKKSDPSSETYVPSLSYTLCFISSSFFRSLFNLFSFSEMDSSFSVKNDSKVSVNVFSFSSSLSVSASSEEAFVRVVERGKMVKWVSWRWWFLLCCCWWFWCRFKKLPPFFACEMVVLIRKGVLVIIIVYVVVYVVLLNYADGWFSIQNGKKIFLRYFSKFYNSCFELLLLLHDAPFQPVPDRSRIVVQLFRGEPAQL